MTIKDALVHYRCWKAYFTAGKANNREINDVTESLVAIGDAYESQRVVLMTAIQLLDGVPNYPETLKLKEWEHRVKTVSDLLIREWEKNK